MVGSAYSHCIFADVLFQGENRDQQWLERWQQVRVQADQVGDQFEGVGGGLGSQMFELQWATLSQTNCLSWRFGQDGFCIRTGVCEHGASSTTSADVDDGWISELELQFAGPSPSDLKENATSHLADEFDELTGARLPGELVHAGKMEEIRWVKEIGLHKKISRAKQSGGIAVVPIRWVVTHTRETQIGQR